MSEEEAHWRPISEGELHTLVDEQLAECSPEDQAVFQKIRIPLRKLAFDRGTFREDVFAVAAAGDKLVFYDDVENGLEVGTPDADGVLRLAGCGQFELRHVLGHLRQGWR